MRALPPALLLSLAVTACSEPDPAASPSQPGPSGLDAGADAEPPPPPAADAPTWHRDVAPLVEAYCAPCHSPGASAPFALNSYADAAPRAGQLASEVTAREMPPYPAAPAVRPYMFDISLTDAQIEVFRTWAAAGAPEGDIADAQPAPDVSFGLLENPNLELQMPEAFTPTQSPDHYRCFVLPWPEQETKYITGFNVLADNAPIVHHAVLYLVDPAQAGVVDAAEGLDGEPGYSCFGSASPEGGESIPTRQIGGWAPGSLGTPYAPGTGVVVRAGARVVLQMHYNTLGVSAPQVDQSRVQFRLESSVERDGGNLPWLDLNWPNVEGSMRIPAGQAGVVHAYEDDPRNAPLAGLFIPDIDLSAGVRLHTVYPHMHQLGRRLDASVIRANGEVVPLAHISDWDFHWQREYPFIEPVDVLPGDRLRVECEFDNTAENQAVINGELQRPRDVDFGEGSYDEMCVAAFYVTGLREAAPSACDALGARPAPQGRLKITFDAAANVRGSAALDGPLRGAVTGAVYRAEDVSLAGPAPGAMPVAAFRFDDVDVTVGPSAEFALDVDLPAGNYHALGFMDIDGNADPMSPDPDVGDPVFIPVRPIALECDTQPVTLTFALLLPAGQ
jgi:hypothetical protein